jgi:hypothetical protein
MLHRPGDVSRTHVHDDLCDLFGLGSMFSHSRGKRTQGLRTPIFGHHQQISALGIDHIGHVTPTAPRTGLIHQDAPTLLQSLSR